MEQDQQRVRPAPAAQGDPGGARRGRRRAGGARRAARAARRGGAARGGAQGGRARARAPAQMPPASAEYTVVRTYLEWLVDLPWAEAHARTTSTSAHARDRSSTRTTTASRRSRSASSSTSRCCKLNGRSKKGPILCFVGPPGVGKTSLGQSIARALGRKFVRISLGGVRDEAEIRGHRRTYVGALPGRIIQGMRSAGVEQPGVHARRDRQARARTSAATRRRRCSRCSTRSRTTTFRDHYLDVPFDLSKVIFIATANMLDTIPPPLRDRMEVIELPGYTEEEKLEIARRHLSRSSSRRARARRRSSSSSTDDGAAARSSASTRARPACATSSARSAASAASVARQIARGRRRSRSTVDGRDDLRRVPRAAARSARERRGAHDEPGVATGLAWTPVGGDMLFIEASRCPGKGRLQLTGQLGDVMQESAQAALSLRRGRARTSSGIDAGRRSRRTTSTSTCRRARCRRTARRRASRWRRRSSRCSRGGRSATTSR